MEARRSTADTPPAKGRHGAAEGTQGRSPGGGPRTSPPHALPPSRPPVPTAAARRSPFASLPRPQRAMLTAPRRLLRLCSSTFRMGESASRLPRKEEALPGRSQRVAVAGRDRTGRPPPPHPSLRRTNPGPRGGLALPASAAAHAHEGGGAGGVGRSAVGGRGKMAAASSVFES